MNTSGSIQIQLTVTDLVEQTHDRYNDDYIKKIELMQLKAVTGYRDVYSWLKEQIISGNPFKIGIIIGKTGIIDSYIKHQLRESIGFYDNSFHRINLSAEDEIMATLDRLNQDQYGLIALSRGGGDNLDIFNRLSIAEKAAGLQSVFITAIGHKDDITLLQKVADKAFITPSELGQFLIDTYNHTVEELESSKARVIEAVKLQLTANYQKEIDNRKANEELQLQTAKDFEQVYQEKIQLLNGQLLSEQQLQGERIGRLNEQMNNYKNQIAELKGKSLVSWPYLIMAVIFGLIIGYLLHRI